MIYCGCYNIWTGKGIENENKVVFGLSVCASSVCVCVYVCVCVCACVCARRVGNSVKAYISNSNIDPAILSETGIVRVVAIPFGSNCKHLEYVCF